MKIQNLKNPKNVVSLKPTLKCYIDPQSGLLTPFNPRVKGNELVKSKS